MNLDFRNAKREIIDGQVINELKKAKDVIIFGAGGSGNRERSITLWMYYPLSQRSTGIQKPPYV